MAERAGNHEPTGAATKFRRSSRDGSKVPGRRLASTRLMALRPGEKRRKSHGKDVSRFGPGGIWKPRSFFTYPFGRPLLGSPHNSSFYFEAVPWRLALDMDPGPLLLGLAGFTHDASVRFRAFPPLQPFYSRTDIRGLDGFPGGG